MYIAPGTAGLTGATGGITCSAEAFGSTLVEFGRCLTSVPEAVGGVHEADEIVDSLAESALGTHIVEQLDCRMGDQEGIEPYGAIHCIPDRRKSLVGNAVEHEAKGMDTPCRHARGRNGSSAARNASGASTYGT